MDKDHDPSHICQIMDRNISKRNRTKFQNFNVSRLVLHLALPNPLKQGVKLRMKL